MSSSEHDSPPTKFIIDTKDFHLIKDYMDLQIREIKSIVGCPGFLRHLLKRVGSQCDQSMYEFIHMHAI